MASLACFKPGRVASETLSPSAKDKIFSLSCTCFSTFASFSGLGSNRRLTKSCRERSPTLDGHGHVLYLRIHCSRPLWFGGGLVAVKSIGEDDKNTSSSSESSEDLFGNNEDQFSGLEAKLQRIQDGVQIFLATFLWMSLFFWASAWDGRNNNKPNKRSKF